jgi:hypothetical protein
MNPPNFRQLDVAENKGIVIKNSLFFMTFDRREILIKNKSIVKNKLFLCPYFCDIFWLLKIRKFLFLSVFLWPSNIR